MKSQNASYYMKAAWIWIAALTLARFVYSGMFLLTPDETNYWQWSRHMAWGYHDQAPMIAWLINLSTKFLGHTETAVRLPSVLAMGVASIYLVAIAKRWIGSAAAFHTAVLTQAILIFNVGALLATADGIQAAAWAGAAYHVARAYEKGTWPQWLIGGFWFGFGMLSKFTMVIFLPGVFVYGLLSTAHRQRLATIRPYAGLLFGCLLFFPVILWNARNSWNAARHVAFIGGANQNFTLHLRYFGDYLASQAGLLTPLVFILVIAAWVLSLRKSYWQKNRIYLYLFFTSFPMVAGFAALSLHTQVYGNWPAAGYLTASVLAAAFFGGKETANGKKRRPAGRKLWFWTIGTAYGLTLLLLVQVVWPVMPLPIDIDRTSTELQGWRQLGEKAGQMLKEMPKPDNTFLFGLRYQIASELAFYAPGQPMTVSINKWKRPNVYDYWWEDADLIGKDAVGVSYEKKTQLQKLFERVDPPIKFEIYREAVFNKNKTDRKPVEVFYLHRAYGFKGGLRWEPADRSDIRAN
jgi:4-amino-4-deoxy-L-arabinose transferase-like glycosyltransferase